LGDAGVDGRIILKWIIVEQSVRAWTGFIWLKMGSVAGSCEQPSDSIKDGDIFDHLSRSQLLKKHFAP
jgi:hypothetical protein